MSTRSGILAGGNWIVDKVKFIDTYPRQDALANIRSESICNGGAPFNVLTDLFRLGASFPLAGVGLVGKDADGEWVLRQCARERIDTTRLPICEKAHTAYTDVMTVQASGRRTFFHQRGANAFLGDEHFDFAGETSKLFHLGYLLLLDRLDLPDPDYGTVAARVLHRATEAGYKTSVDVVSEESRRFPEVVLPALRHVDYCLLNEFEIERTTGIETRRDDVIDLDAVKGASQKLLEAGVREWVIVHFPEGACALGKDGVLKTQGSIRVPQSKIVGMVGAGDAFAAGLLYGLHEEVAVERALQYGVASAASCLFGAGSSDGIQRLDECLKLAQNYGFQPLEGGNHVRSGTL